MKKQKRHPFFDPFNWIAVEVTEAGRTWWEVRAEDSILVVSNSESGSAWKFRSLRAAQRCRDEENRKESERTNRIERVV